MNQLLFCAGFEHVVPSAVRAGCHALLVAYLFLATEAESRVSVVAGLSGV